MEQAPFTTKGLNLNGTLVNPTDEDGQVNFKTRRAVADVAATLNAHDYLIAYSTLTATRAFTLGAASAYPNQHFVIKDESGNGAVGVKITAVGTLDGAVNPDLIATAYGVKKFYSNGVAWFSE